VAVKEAPIKDVPPIWKCSSCKASFPSTERDNAALAHKTEIEKLRAVWHTKDDMLAKSYAAGEHKSDDALIKAAHNKLEASTERAWFAYAAAAFRTNVWRVPNALVSVRKNGCYSLVCDTCRGIVPAEVAAFAAAIGSKFDEDIDTWENEGGSHT